MSNDGTLTQTHTETRETRESRANGHGAERTTALVEVHTENGAAGCWPESSCVRIAFAWKMRIFELIGESQSSTLLEKHTQMKINKFRPALCWGERARHRKASGFGCGGSGGCGVCHAWSFSTKTVFSQPRQNATHITFGRQSFLNECGGGVGALVLTRERRQRRTLPAPTVVLV